MTRSCSAINCASRSQTNKLSEVKFFKFPWNPERRKAWAAAVKREGWSPNDNSLLCSFHFVTGCPSKDPNHPDWVPSVFKHKINLNPSASRSRSALDRFNRLKQRQESKQETNLLEGVMETDIEESDTSDKFKDSYVQTTAIETCSSATQTDLTGEDISELLQCQASLLKENNQIRTAMCNSTKIVDFENDDAKIKHYTGLPNCIAFNTILKYILLYWRPDVPCSLPYAEQLLLVLMKLRLGLTNVDLGYRFEIGARKVSTLFHCWLSILAVELKCLIVWPSRNVVKKRMPKNFRKPQFRNLRCIIDCTEIFIERPLNFTARSQTYSQYKHHNTAKFLVAISPTGGISFVSACWGGRVSDLKLTKESSFLDLLEPGDLVMADRGFDLTEQLAVRGASLLIPAFTKGKSQLSRKEVENSRCISRVRIHVERIIGQLKNFKILQGPVPITLMKRKSDTEMSTLDKIVIVCSALVNLQGPIF